MPYREGKRWRGVVKFRGQRYQRLLPTKKAAIDWERDKIAELTKNSKQPPKGLVLVSLCTNYLLHAQKYTPKTFQEKQSLTKRLLKFLGPDTPVPAVTSESISLFLSARATMGDSKKKSHLLSGSGHALNRDRKHLSSMWNWGIRILDDMKGMSNPVQNIEKWPHDRKPQYVPPEVDVLKVLAAATAEERVFIKCYTQTAARRTEIFRWTWIDDINFERRMVRLGTRKSKDGSMKYDWLPMSQDLYETLTWWWKNRPVKNALHVFVVSNPHHRNYGKPFTQRRRFLKSLCNRAGVREFGYHALRRYVASILSDKYKASTKTIQRILRHERMTTTEIYIESLNTDLRGTMEMLSETKETFSETKKPSPETKVPLDGTPKYSEEG